MLRHGVVSLLIFAQTAALAGREHVATAARAPHALLTPLVVALFIERNPALAQPLNGGFSQP